MTDARRRLPVISNAPAKKPSGDAPPSAPAPEETPSPPWHWVPLGAVITLGAGVVLAKLVYMPIFNRKIESVCRGLDEVACRDAVTLAMTRAGFRWPLSLLALAVWSLSVACGAWVVGRYGTRTNDRHGMLGAMSATLLVVLAQGHGLDGLSLLLYMLLVPVAGVIGLFVARAGVKRRPLEGA